MPIDPHRPPSVDPRQRQADHLADLSRAVDRLTRAGFVNYGAGPPTAATPKSVFYFDETNGHTYSRAGGTWNLLANA